FAVWDPAGSGDAIEFHFAYAADYGLASIAHTRNGDHVGMNGAGDLSVTSPSGRVFHASNCCGTTTTPIDAGVVADGHWRVASQFSCCGGWPRFGWTIADWTV